jgi:hypothetical protein
MVGLQFSDPLSCRRHATRACPSFRSVYWCESDADPCLKEFQTKRFPFDEGWDG